MTARQQAWGHIRRLGADEAEFTAEAVWRAMRGPGKSSRNNIAGYMAALARDGILEVTATARGKAAAYRLSEDPGPLAPHVRSDRQGTAPAAPGCHARPRSQRAMIWDAVRAFGQRRQMFSAWDILVRVTGTRSPKGLSTVRAYLWALSRAGYLVQIRDGNVRRYRVKRDTGPKHPIPRTDGLHDPNTGTDHIREVGS